MQIEPEFQRIHAKNRGKMIHDVLNDGNSLEVYFWWKVIQKWRHEYFLLSTLSNFDRLIFMIDMS